jgi:hypothetical protein
VGGQAFEQRAPEPSKWMLDNDAGFRAKAKGGVLGELIAGKVNVADHLVRAPGGSQVTVAEFVIDTLKPQLVAP